MNLLRNIYKTFGIREKCHPIKVDYGKTPRTILRFETHLTEHCNLGCKSCGHMSPLAKEEFLDIVGFEKDCSRLSYLTGRKIELIDLMGGEPLLHPRKEEILRITRHYFPEGKINIVTNGLLLSSQNEKFYISAYPIEIDVDKIQSLVSRYHVNLVWRSKKTSRSGFVHIAISRANKINK